MLILWVRTAAYMSMVHVTFRMQAVTKDARDKCLNVVLLKVIAQHSVSLKAVSEKSII